MAVALVVAGLLLAGAYGTWYLFLRPAGPAAVGSTSAPVPTLAPAATSSPGASSSAGSSSAPQTDGIDGTWTVDTSIGSFSDFSSSFVGYRVQEELASIGGNTAVGRTPNVSGTMTIAGTQVSEATIEADLTTLESDDDRRDGQLRQRGIQTNQFPTATFKLTSPIELGSVPTDGQEVSVTANGQFTLHGVTNDVQIPLKAKLSGDVIAVTGSLPITFADYGVEAPSSFVVVSIDDHGTMELQLFFTRS
ncbi:MAG TPA: YceI family protein [Acidimicrobiales bacterium]